MEVPCFTRVVKFRAPVRVPSSVTACFAIAAALCLGGCSNLGQSPSSVAPRSVAPGGFARGADIGWLDQMERSGYVFRDDSGQARDCLEILREHGIDSVRLRVWVNPSSDPVNGHCGPDEVARMARRAKDAGFRVMIDFHYSDRWADPGNQVKPAAWTGHSFDQLLDDVESHTADVLSRLSALGVTPEWVQVGNEINPGILLPDGSSTDYARLARLLNRGARAVKAASPGTKVIVHLASGADNAFCRTFFDGLAENGAEFDVIGLSWYPYWLGSDYRVTAGDLFRNMRDLVARYGKQVMVVEVGGDYSLPAASYETVAAAMDCVSFLPDGSGLGVFYWEPAGAKSWSGYQLSAWGDDGKPTAALDAFLRAPAVPVDSRTGSGTEICIRSAGMNAPLRYLAVDGSDSWRVKATAGAKPEEAPAAGSAAADDSVVFVLVRNPDDTVSFKSKLNGKYVSARSATAILAADSETVGAEQKFAIVSRADGCRAIISAALDTSLDVGTDSAVRSRWADSEGGWQSFFVVKR